MRRRKEIRDLIHEAAIREFARNGLAGTSTQAIAESAGITKAQLHYYIASKESLYREILGDIIRQWKDIFFIGADGGDPATVLSDYIARKVRHALEHPDVSRLFAREMARGAPAMAEHWEDLKEGVARATAIIRGWIDSGQMDPVDPLLFQVNIWAVTQHCAEYEAQLRVLMDVDDIAPLDSGRIVAEATALFLARCGLGPGSARAARAVAPAGTGVRHGGTGAGFVSGEVLVSSVQNGILGDGTVPESVTAQAELCFARLGAALSEQRTSLAHVLRVTGYVTRPEHVAPYEAVRDRVFRHLGPPPAGSVLVVAALARPEFLVEVDALAVRPASDRTGAPGR